MERYCKNALEVAKYLEALNKVESILYPGLENDKNYPLAQKHLKGASGNAIKFMDALKLASNEVPVEDTALEDEEITLQEESDVVLELMRKNVSENARAVQDQTEYQRRYNTLVERYDKAKNRLAEVSKTISMRNAKRQELERFLRVLKKQDGLLTKFDEDLWLATVHQMVVKEVLFIFKDGTELPWTI